MHSGRNEEATVEAAVVEGGFVEGGGAVVMVIH